MRTIIKVVLGLFVFVCIAGVLIVALIGGGSDNTGEKVETKTESDVAPASSTPVAGSKPETFAVGDVVKVSDHTITLNSATFSGNILKANFTIENQGSDEIAVSSLLSFSARDAEGTNLELEIFDCGSGVDGSVLAGDKLKGNICWKNPISPVKIYYEASLFASGAVVWEVKD